MKSFTVAWKFILLIGLPFNITSLSPIDPANESKNLSSFDVYVEPTIASEFAFIALKNEYQFSRIVEKKGIALESIGEKLNLPRYQQPKGFILFRTNEDGTWLYDNQKEIENSLNEFLKNQGEEFTVFFYNLDLEKINYHLVQGKGKIFNPKHQNTGLFFVKKEKTVNEKNSGQAYILIYYNFEDDLETSEHEFRKISGYIYPIDEGVIKGL